MQDGQSLVGFVLTGSTTSKVFIQLTELGEKKLIEGSLVIIESTNKRSYLVNIESIIPYSESFTQDSPFVLARRKGIKIGDFISSIDKRYTVAEGKVIGELSSIGLKDALYPPIPGDPVVLFDFHKHSKQVLGVEPGDPGIIWFGNLIGYSNNPIPLSIENITMHMGIFGNTGSGKSYAIGCLIEKLGAIPLGDNIEGALPIIIVDANGDYLDYYYYFEKKYIFKNFDKVYRFVFKNSKVDGLYINHITITLEEFKPRELAELIISYKTGAGGEINELQVYGLEKALTELLEEGYVLDELFTKNKEILLNKIDSLSTKEGGQIIHHSTARAIKTAIEKFYDEVVKKLKLISKEPSINSEFIDNLVDKPSLVIIDYSSEGAPGVPLIIKQLVIAYIARLLYKKFTEYKIKREDKYLLFIIEEAQNYIPSRSYPVGASIARDILSLIATQGRKFGLCLALVSQRPSFIDPVVLSMLNTFLIFRISPEDLSYVSKLSGGLPESLKAKVTSLSRGIAILTGQMSCLNYPLLINIGKREVEHRMGTTNLVQALRKIYGKKNAQ